MKIITIALCNILFLIQALTTLEAQKLPIALFDFNTGECGWTKKTLNRGADGNEWTHRVGQDWACKINNDNIQDTWLISPVIDLSGADQSVMFINALVSSSAPNTTCNVYIQEAYQLTMETQDDEAFINQWGEKNQELNKTNTLVSGISEGNGLKSDEPDAIDISQWDCKRIRIAFRVTGKEITTAQIPYNWGLKHVVLAGYFCDCGYIEPNIPHIDVIDNTHVEASFTEEEFFRIYWAVNPQDKPIDFVEDIKANLGNGKFIKSGSFDYFSPEDGVVNIEGLAPNMEYNLFYGTDWLDSDCYLSPIYQLSFNTDIANSVKLDWKKQIRIYSQNNKILISC
ncbi:MAG: hypothetical protein N4A74_03460 [Carboxylicivirga sp.]|jgi:hypothetical protein|nr:hypothetical protein [Carboxylicivirga sp.]